MIGLYTAIIGGITSYLGQRQEAKEAARKDEAAIATAKTKATIKRIESGDTAASDLDMYMVQNNGLKDDISFYIFLLPAVMVFFPDMVQVIEDGFAVLDKTPVWYQAMLAGMLIAVWGYRRMIRPLIEAVVAKKMGAI